jgi:hypothetical protein
LCKGLYKSCGTDVCECKVSKFEERDEELAKELETVVNEVQLIIV